MTQPSEEFCVYEVKPGDSLSAIAAHFGYVTPTQIARINHLPFMSCGLPPVFPGQRLIIPTVARTDADSVKIKRLPGVALRIEDMENQNVSDKNSGFLAVEPFFYTTRVRSFAKSSTSVDDDALERQFIKVDAHRILRNLDNLVDGVLLVTPESLCFDASETAFAQKQAYIASHSDNGAESGAVNNRKMSDPLDDPNDKLPTCHTNLESSCCHIPQELINLGLCIPLDSISALKTLSEKDVISFLSSDTGGKTKSSSNSSFQNEEIHEHHKYPLTDELSESTNKNADEDKQVDSSQFSNEQSVEIGKPLRRKSSSSTTNTDDIENFSSQASSSPQRLLSTSLEKLESPIASQLLPVKNDTEDNNIHESTVVKYLYLRVTLVGDENHIFRLTVDCLTQVYSFLLRAGVGSSDLTRQCIHGSENTAAEDLGNQLCVKERKMDPVSTVCHRRSVIEEILESMEESTPVPSLYGGESRILTNKMLADLSVNFPAHWTSSNLNSIYKSEDDGYCLNTVYRKCKDVEGGVLLIIRDTMGVVFGSVMSEGMKCSKGFYGTGETFVFHWKPTFKKYCWTKKNYFFMRGSPHSFHIGGQSGRNAIWFDESLKYGRSEPTDTFDNPVLSGNLPDFQFSALSINKTDVNGNESSENTAHSAHSNCIHSESNKKLSSVEYNSVPFVIDTFELWQLVS
ncbi:unnamed protein product [Heterobilharzia americana]|nr:unnamed protein product [Heterobilharzia americana]